jgi:hypothetical protein
MWPAYIRIIRLKLLLLRCLQHPSQYPNTWVQGLKGGGGASTTGNLLSGTEVRSG